LWVSYFPFFPLLSCCYYVGLLFPHLPLPLLPVPGLFATAMSTFYFSLRQILHVIPTSPCVCVHFLGHCGIVPTPAHKHTCPCCLMHLPSFSCPLRPLRFSGFFLLRFPPETDFTVSLTIYMPGFFPIYMFFFLLAPIFSLPLYIVSLGPARPSPLSPLQPQLSPVYPCSFPFPLVPPAFFLRPSCIKPLPCTPLFRLPFPFDPTTSTLFLVPSL